MFFFLISPIKSDAAWWNPKTWFSDQVVSPVLVSPAVETVEIPVEIEMAVEKPVIQEKIVTKLVDNPKLLEQIESLKKENLQLRSSLDYAVKQMADKDAELQRFLADVSKPDLTPFDTSDIEMVKSQSKEEGIKQGTEEQKKKEVLFFNGLILNSEDPDFGHRICSKDQDTAFPNKLDTFVQSCTTFANKYWQR